MPQINLELSMRPRRVQVSNESYEVNIFFEETLAKTLDVCYNTYQEAEDAAREYIMEKLN